MSEVVGAVALVVGVSWVGLVVHEFGHALAAHLTGFRIRLVYFGRLAATRGAAGWRVQWLRERVGRGGGVNVDPVRPEHLRRRHFVVVAGGPAAHLLLAGAMLGALACGEVCWWWLPWCCCSRYASTWCRSA